MLLAINIGNSSTSLGLYAEGKWVERWRIHTNVDRTADEHRVLFRSLLAEEGFAVDRISRSVLCSVVPPLTGTVSEVVGGLTGSQPLLVGPGIRTGIRIRTDNPAEVGADLVADAVAGYARFRSSCIVADFGTALSFTAVAEPGDLMGVAISPGLAYATEALAERTAQLPVVQLKMPPSAIGKNTTHSIQAGVVFGYLGLVEALIDRIRAELPPPVKAVATGGQSGIIAPLTDRFDAIDPWLTLEGLRLIAERNPP